MPVRIRPPVAERKGDRSLEPGSQFRRYAVISQDGSPSLSTPLPRHDAIPFQRRDHHCTAPVYSVVVPVRACAK